MELKQYHIAIVNLEPTLGSEIKKTRPCVIISPDVMNKYLNTIVIAPITNVQKKYPTRVEVKNKNAKGQIALDQIRTIDRVRIINLFNSISEKEILSVKQVLKETYVD
ncbi:MAG: type II toxin-antitoxin system PemK/MazF family toxin [Saprospiraceae bacterium]|jgi:mRNA interferase MazF|uniref:type II toxin-antitoxin system PemK/MazF family toxin n=1 Tax=Candidatus Brachybacter algidus TaxID=2982024 RepID=UPI001B60F102|nr:type II toxin-antitoxin system PemK/MazF family toxin [Candidatus Brachybacter algidus]MBP7306857.1 type II toxin-antitoxin system PemK/MazF family toxin [Saprospiraceae bacterium]MBK6374022.1 type II toxin-antitoxin system PemK/MazF family toxin [Candidatus Brachybacter algidus]MBK6449178.1 type II toxin-antitoxin system PemK/MazF family toxin [Candidatus Brachybacter algidus]MBK7602140.1 type II toxin-antitoxin system PemK/MazF family toxin [Candidatus Brachybacter algidus]MBK8355783.1 ty